MMSKKTRGKPSNLRRKFKLKPEARTSGRSSSEVPLLDASLGNPAFSPLLAPPHRFHDPISRISPISCEWSFMKGSRGHPPTSIVYFGTRPSLVTFEHRSSSKLEGGSHAIQFYVSVPLRIWLDGMLSGQY
jgi:hypothetical protein